MRSARRHRSLWRQRLLSILCLCLLPRLALADSAQARVHFDRGRAYFEGADYRQAIVEFKAAHIERPDPAFLYNIAESYRRLGEASEALGFYRRFLATAPPGDKTRPIVEQRIAELKAVDDGKPPSGGAAGGDAELLALDAQPPASERPGSVLVEQPAARRSDAPAPFYVRPWFWITVGAVVAGCAISIWALSRAPEPPGTTLGNQSVF